MSERPLKIAIAGTHSTGKTTFLGELRDRLEADGARVRYVHDSAVAARGAGFPILWDHTVESTAWLMARAIQLECEASLDTDVVLVDRPVADALGYLIAALRHTDREADAARMAGLEAIAAAWAGEYDLLLLTSLDETIPLGAGRDGNAAFRSAAGAAVAEVVGRVAPAHDVIRPGHEALALQAAMAAWTRHRRA